MHATIFNTHDVVLLMTAYQCILFAILLLTARRERRLTNTLLALFLLQQAAIPLDILISFGAEFREIALEWSPNLFYVFGFGYWLEGPLLLWYTRSLVYKDYRLTARDLLYLLPFAVYLVHQLIFYYSLDFATKKTLQEEYDLLVAPHYMNFVTLFRDLFRAALGVVCLLEIRRYGKHLKRNYSDVDKLDLSWLRLLVIGFLGIRVWAVLVAVLMIMSIMLGVSVDFEAAGLMGNYVTFILVSILIFFGLSHSTVGVGLESRTPAAEGGKDDSSKDKIKPEMAEHLSRWMDEHKPYLIPALTLEKLAGQLQIPPRTLSNIINRHFNCNFFEFINHYRVEEAKRLLADPQTAGKHMIDLMYEMGFNSKATFNALFKKKVGMTPSEFRKQASQQKG